VSTAGARTAAAVIPATKVGTGPDGRDFYRPIVIVTIDVRGHQIQGAAMVDSGADNTLVPAETLASVGIDFDALPEGAIGAGVGGPLATRRCAGTVRYQEWEVCRSFSVAEPGKLDIILLGRADFFTMFETRFRWHAVPPEFEIEPIAGS